MKIAKYEDIELEQSAEIVHTITEDDIQAFGDLSGDYNPLHFNDDWAKTTFFKGRIAHGLLVASFISTAIGMKLPGTGTIYVSQQMSFKRPTRIGDTIKARVEVIEKQDEKKQVVLRTTCTNQDGDIVLDGPATVALMRE